MVRRRDTDSVDAAERPSLEHYRRFLTLVRQRHRRALEPARARRARRVPRARRRLLGDPRARLPRPRRRWRSALGEARIADESRAAGERVAAALQARAGSDGLIRAVDAVDDSPLAVTSAGSALALLSPGLTTSRSPPRAPPCSDGPLASRYGVRSLDAPHPERSARNYWRGPVWANVTWLTALGLAPPRRAARRRGAARAR